MILVDVAIIAIFLLALSMFSLFLWSIVLGAPFVPTSRNVTEVIVRTAALKAGETVYDLGCGDARLLVCAKRTVPEVIAKGYERSPVVYCYAKLRVFLSGTHVLLFKKNLFSANLSDADCIFVYLLPQMMQKLQEKFDRELQPGTRVITETFSFQGRKASRHVPIMWMGKERQLSVYEWPAL